MDDLIDMIVTDESPSDISDKIKELLFAKSAQEIESVRPEVASSMFDYSVEEESEYEEYDDEVEEPEE